MNTCNLKHTATYCNRLTPHPLHEFTVWIPKNLSTSFCLIVYRDRHSTNYLHLPRDEGRWIHEGSWPIAPRSRSFWQGQQPNQELNTTKWIAWFKSLHPFKIKALFVLNALKIQTDKWYKFILKPLNILQQQTYCSIHS